MNRILCLFTLAVMLPSVCEAQLEFQSSAKKIKPFVPSVDRMDFLQDRGLILMIAKNSIIVLPKQFESKKVDGRKAEGRLAKLNEFIANNTNWFTTYQVKRGQVFGTEKIPKAELERLQQMNKIVVAVHGKSTVSVSKKALIHEEGEINEN